MIYPAVTQDIVCSGWHYLTVHNTPASKHNEQVVFEPAHQISPSFTSLVPFQRQRSSPEEFMAGHSMVFHRRILLYNRLQALLLTQCRQITGCWIR